MLNVFDSILRRTFRRRCREEAVSTLYESVVRQSRLPCFYTKLGIPDTPEGRYDLLVLHMWLVLRRLGNPPNAATKAFAQDVFDLMFSDMDINLREMGINDLAVGRRIRRMVEAFYGRVAAYDRGVEEGEATLADALQRNLYQGKESVSSTDLDWMVAYVQRQIRNLGQLDAQAMISGRVSFVTPECAS